MRSTAPRLNRRGCPPQEIVGGRQGPRKFAALCRCLSGRASHWQNAAFAGRKRLPRVLPIRLTDAQESQATRHERCRVRKVPEFKMGEKGGWCHPSSLIRRDAHHRNQPLWTSRTSNVLDRISLPWLVTAELVVWAALCCLINGLPSLATLPCMSPRPACSCCCCDRRCVARNDCSRHLPESDNQIDQASTASVSRWCEDGSQTVPAALREGAATCHT